VSLTTGEPQFQNGFSGEFFSAGTARMTHTGVTIAFGLWQEYRLYPKEQVIWRRS
jgi:hypothetical protein